MNYKALQKLAKQKIVITGANGGIAKACTKLLASTDAEIIVTARTEEVLDKALEGTSGNVRAYTLDLYDEESIKNVFAEIGKFDHLVTPAATSTFSPISQLDLSATRNLIESKQWGQMLCVIHALPYLNKKGSITLFSGTVSQKPMEGATGFAAVGAATEAMARVWAHELAPLRVNTIVPGVIETDAWTQLLGSQEAAKEQLNAIASVLPVGRVGQPDDIAEAVLFSICNGFLNGSSIVLDGGHRVI